MLFVSLITTLDLVESDCLLSTELSDAYSLVGREKMYSTEQVVFTINTFWVGAVSNSLVHSMVLMLPRQSRKMLFCTTCASKTNKCTFYAAFLRFIG